MARKISREQAFCTFMRVLNTSTIVVIAISVLAVIFDFDELLSDRLSKPSDYTGRVGATNQADVAWAFLYGQDSQNINFLYIDSPENNHDEIMSIENDSEDSFEDMILIKIHSVAT